jgi:UDP-N-acetylmuramyl pentapeptide phosphotransferase/UDP-N-acetylglucosamine-1-phosphate transferase
MYLLIFISFFLAEYLYIYLANHFQIFDKPNHRSSHIHVTPRGGGIIFIGIPILIRIINPEIMPLYTLAGLLLLTMVSFYDDLKPLSTGFRFVSHLASIFLITFGYEIEIHWFEWVAVMIIGTGIINAFNFMDGINGISGVFVFSIFIPVWYFFKDLEQFSIITILAVLAFLFFNFRRVAKVFAGDVGSITLAGIVIVLLVLLIQMEEGRKYIFCVSIYGIDTGITMLQRFYQGDNITQAHRKHLFQLLSNELKWPHVWVSLIYGVIQLVFNIIVFQEDFTILQGAIIVFILCAFYSYLKFVKLNHLSIQVGSYGNS